MTNQETAGFNPRTANGSAYDLMNSYTAQQSGIPSGSYPTQQQSYYQTPLAGQHMQQPWQQQQQWQQQPGQQQPGQQHPFAQQPGFNQFQQPSHNQQFQPQPLNYGSQQWHNPNSQMNPYAQSPSAPSQFGQSPYAQSPFNQQQSHSPVVTQRAAELKLKIPIQRILGRHPAEVQQYLMQVVLPVLLDGLTKRAQSNEFGLSITTDMRGELVAEIDI